MNAAIDFLNGNETDNNGRYVSDYLNFTPFEWEANHDIIQWAFPTKTVSLYNPDAPIIPDDFNYTPQNQQTIMYLMILYLSTLGITGHLIGKSIEFDYHDNFDRYNDWIRPHNHNYKRLTRLIECLGLFGLKQAQKSLAEFLIYDFAIKYRKEITADTVVYWLATWQNERDKIQV